MILCANAHILDEELQFWVFSLHFPHYWGPEAILESDSVQLVHLK